MINLEILKPLDYLLIILSLFLIFFTTWKGFIQSLLGLLTWIGSIFITIYFHKYLSEFISTKISEYEYLSQIIPNISFVSQYILAIPIIFFISLFFLKKFRKFLTADLDKSFLGIILDKIFGLIFGVIFCYSVFTTLLISGDIFENNYLKDSVVANIKKNSFMLLKIEENNMVFKPKIETIN